MKTLFVEYTVLCSVNGLGSLVDPLYVLLGQKRKGPLVHENEGITEDRLLGGHWRLSKSVSHGDSSRNGMLKPCQIKNTEGGT